MGYKAAVQVLKQAEDLKSRVASADDLLNNSQAWTNQQKLQTIYHQVLVLDLEYALDKKVEQDLWNVGFKAHISTLQDLIRDKKNPKRSDCQALLTWCLESASGFYITLLQELCNMFELDLPFRRRGIIYGQTKDSVCPDNHNIPQPSSCLYICQYCLVHLGDIARYRNQRKQAECFYNQAIQVSPTSGHPYNQLALLEASQSDKLSTVFYYIRGIAVKNPFPAAISNLASTLNSVLDKESYSQKIQMKMSSNEFIQLFLFTHEHIHSLTDLNQANVCVKSLNTAMTALVATESFTTDKLIKMTVINLYALKNIMANSANTNELTEDEQKGKELVLELLAGSLSAFLMPVHTLKMEKHTLFKYYVLPAVKLLIYWIKQDSKILSHSVFTSRLQIWPSLCKFLNNIQKHLEDFTSDKYSKVPLSEDKFLQGFLPLSEEFESLEFKQKSEIDSETEELIRVKRILEFGEWLTYLDINGRQLITQTKIEGSNEIHFEPSCVQPDPTNELLEEMKSVNVGYGGEAQNKKSSEKRNGILKPQGSLEKAREERELLSNMESNNSSDTSNSKNVQYPHGSKIELAKMKRVKQNVALQSIFKKMEESKQVKFNMEDSEVNVVADKSVKFETKSVTKPQGQFNTSVKMQQFNHNLSPFTSSNKHDYINSLRSVSNMPADKSLSLSFSQPDLSPKKNPNHSLTYQPSNLPFPQSMQPPIQNKAPSGFSPAVQTSFPFGSIQQIPTFTNVSAQPHQYNMWKPEETTSMQSPPWWQTANATLPHNHRQISLGHASMQPNQMPLPMNTMGQNHNTATSNFNLQSNHNMLPLNHSGMQPNHSSLAPNKASLMQNQLIMVSNHAPLTPNHSSSATNMSLPLNHGYQSMDRFANNSYLPANNLRTNVSYIQNSPVTKSQSSNDIFNSPWSTFGRATFIGDGNSISYDNTRAMSMRQAMLKEASNIPGDLCMPMNRPVNQQSDNLNQSQNNTSSYSLFNTNSWTPNLAGQLRNTSSCDAMQNNLAQQSLFTNQNPQSLTQLLEQQNKLHHSDS